jgi:hypothetical protein
MVYFQTKNPNLGKFRRVLQRKMSVYIFYGHCVYFTAIWYILWPFGIFYGRLVIFSPFWYVAPRKIWQPLEEALRMYTHRYKSTKKVSPRLLPKITIRPKFCLKKQENNYIQRSLFFFFRHNQKTGLVFALSEPVLLRATINFIPGPQR